MRMRNGSEGKTLRMERRNKENNCDGDEYETKRGWAGDKRNRDEDKWRMSEKGGYEGCGRMMENGEGNTRRRGQCDGKWGRKMMEIVAEENE